MSVQECRCHSTPGHADPEHTRWCALCCWHYGCKTYADVKFWCGQCAAIIDGHREDHTEHLSFKDKIKHVGIDAEALRKLHGS